MNRPNHEQSLTTAPIVIGLALPTVGYRRDAWRLLIKLPEWAVRIGREGLMSRPIRTGY